MSAMTTSSVNWRRASLVTAGLLALALGVAAGIAPANAASPVAAPGLPMATAPIVNKTVGNGTAASCTESKLFNAMRTGGNIKFNCGPNKVTIKITKTLRTCNTHNCKHPWQGGKPLTTMTLDGGGKVTLSGGGKVGIFYANACEPTFGWLSSRCDLDKTLTITFKNLTFVSGNATKGVPGKQSVGGGGGGGAIAMRGNKLVVQNSTFKSNRCITKHSDAGGGAIRAVGVKSVRISGSTFTGNYCANGGAISSLQSPMSITSSTITGNNATGTGASSGKGGNGGGVYFDGGSQNVTITGTTISKNKVGAGGSGVFYVSNNRGGTLTIKNSKITSNTGEKFWTGSRKDLFFLGKKLVISGSTIN